MTILFTPSQCELGKNNRCKFELDYDGNFIRSLSICSNHRGLIGKSHFEQIKKEQNDIAKVQRYIDEKYPEKKSIHHREESDDDSDGTDSDEIEYEYPIKVSFEGKRLRTVTVEIPFMTDTEKLDTELETKVQIQ
jgi:hypothetical protein